ncbi:MAG: type IV pilus twitching motility protein PilT [Bdellovibrio sp.]|nr:type IV pilus twitching motility protein PilT [Bdellovibrio sp.]
MSTQSLFKIINPDVSEANSLIQKSELDEIKTGSKQASKIQLKYLIRAMIKHGASDLHLKTSRAPIYRINGKLIPAKLSELQTEQVRSIILSILSKRQMRELEEKRQIDLSFEIKGAGRIRCNIYFQRETLSAALRMIPIKIPSLDELGIPPVIKELCEIQRGMLLITGASGSGKSTTLAAVIQYLNENYPLHILTIEDPIEFTFQDIKSIITQREIGSDALSMKDALTAGLRQDPDVIVIGEMREFETIQVALTAAETGHLVISTLHTNDAKNTIDRILDVFPVEAQNQVRIQLASSLIGVISQQLLTRSNNSGQIPACEILVNSPTIQECIRNNERNQIPEVIENSSNYYKMQSMNVALEKLVSQNLITQEEALKSSRNHADLKLKLSGVTHHEAVPLQTITKKII